MNMWTTRSYELLPLDFQKNIFHETGAIGILQRMKLNIFNFQYPRLMSKRGLIIWRFRNLFPTCCSCSGPTCSFILSNCQLVGEINATFVAFLNDTSGKILITGFPGNIINMDFVTDGSVISSGFDLNVTSGKIFYFLQKINEWACGNSSGIEALFSQVPDAMLVLPPLICSFSFSPLQSSLYSCYYDKLNALKQLKQWAKRSYIERQIFVARQCLTT